MTKNKAKAVDKLIEIILRAIPKERQAHDIYAQAAAGTKIEMTRLLFEMLAEQEEQHEAKLRAALEILDQEKRQMQDQSPGGETVAETGVSGQERIKDLRRLVEVVVRMIPKERMAHDFYLSASRQAYSDMTRSMFELFAEQENLHETKLRAVLELLKTELKKVGPD